MCGRYAASKDTAALVEQFEVLEVVDPPPGPNYNVAPTQTVSVVVERPADSGPSARQLRRARWGLVPPWAKDVSVGNRMINARWESVTTKPAYRAAFAKRRCIIPADGYFEWQATAQAARARSAKQPYFIHRADGAALGMAGVFEFWRASATEPWLMSMAVLTTAAAGDLRAIHDRMPVMIPGDLVSAWLDPTERFEPQAIPSLAPGVLLAYPVSTAVNSVSHNGPELLDPLPAPGADL